MHKDLSTGDLLKRSNYNAYSASSVHTVGTNTKDISNDYNSIIESGYDYKGVSKGSDANAKSSYDTNATSISTDENNLYVTFWYQPVATVNYQIVGENKPEATYSVNVSNKAYDTTIERTDYATNSTLERDGYKYKGYVRIDKKYGREPDSGYTTYDACDLKEPGTVLTFWYEPGETPVETQKTATVNFRVVGETGTRYSTSVSVTGTGYDTRIYRTDYPINTTLIGDGYEYKGYVRTDTTYNRQPASGYQLTDYCDLKDNGSVLTFWYEESIPQEGITTPIYSICKLIDSNGNKTDTVIRTRKHEITLTENNGEQWSKTGHPDVSGYVYDNKAQLDDGADNTSSNPTIVVNNDGNTHEIVYWYIEEPEIPKAAIVNFQIVGKTSPEATIDVNFVEDEVNISRNSYSINQKLLDDGYGYVGLTVLVSGIRQPSNGYISSDSRTISDGYVLTFWYQEETTNVTIIYRTEKNILYTDYDDLHMGESETYYPINPSSFGYYNYTGYQESKPISKNKVNTTDTSIGVPVSFDKNDYEIIFWYIPLVKIKMIGVAVTEIYDGDTLLSTAYDRIEGVAVEDEKEITGTSTTYKYDPLKIANYDYLKKCTVIYGTHTYANQAPQKSNVNKAEVTVVEKTNEDPETMILVVFYYDTDTLTVYHVNDYTGNKLTTRTPNPYAVAFFKGTNKTVSSWTDNNNLNLKVELVEGNDISKSGKDITKDVVSLNGKIVEVSSSFKKYGNQKFDIDITSDGNDHTLVFHYTKCNITLNHWLYPIGETEPKKLNITNGYSMDNGVISATSVTDGITNKYLNYQVIIKDTKNDKIITPIYKINNAEVSSITKYTDLPYSISFNIESTDYTIDFYYVQQMLEIRHEWEDGGLVKKRENGGVEEILLPAKNLYPLSEFDFVHYLLNSGEAKTNVPVSVNGDERYGNKQILIFKYTATPHINQGETNVKPNDIYNQSVTQTNADWVLDNANHKLEINVVGEAASGTQLKDCQVNVKLPFDVYINGMLKPKNTVITFSSTSIESFALENIFVPVWVEEKTYDQPTEKISAELILTSSYQTYDDNGVVSQKTESTSYNKDAVVTVVGRVYDFSITNIECDDKWKTSLFTNTKIEHEADTLPIGQDNGYQPNKYVTGILKGANVYFSINTKGSDNSNIKITPSFYHVSQDGSQIQKADLYVKGEKIDTSRIIPLSRNEYRETQEYTKDLLKAKELYDTKYNERSNIGNVTELNLSAPSKMPYTGYLNESEYKLVEGEKTENDILKEVSHWYGNYSIPNESIAYVSGTKTPLTDGFIVIYFNIVTQRGEGANKQNYLAYNLPSPTKNSEISEWLVERDNVGNNYILPKVSAKQTSNKEISPWLDGGDEYGSVAVIIYEADKNSTYTTVGTH